MSIGKMTTLAVAFTSVGGVIGALLGWWMGAYLPDFYRATIREYSDIGRPFDPVQIGVGFGLAQGLIMGFVLACVVLIASAIYSRRPENREV
ncbi:MAG TPA: hypothetical protein VEX38_04750 [Fimbriimonadaceae bacterium]|nr:hypothetical protein [Fimbriimonadaceae bacterium]